MTQNRKTFTTPTTPQYHKRQLTLHRGHLPMGWASEIHPVLTKSMITEPINGMERDTCQYVGLLIIFLSRLKDNKNRVTQTNCIVFIYVVATTVTKKQALGIDKIYLSFTHTGKCCTLHCVFYRLRNVFRYCQRAEYSMGHVQLVQYANRSKTLFWTFKQKILFHDLK